MKLALIAAAALTAAAFATPAMAQAVIEYPGACAQFYPDANCDNLGPGNPYTSHGNVDNYSNNWMNGSDAARGYANGNASMGWDNSRASMERPIERPVRRHHRAHHR